MDRLSEMEAFVTVIDQGGFTDAAKKLGLSKSAVSKHVSALEARLAVRLLNRTTRRVNPTELGLAYYDKARAILSDAADADAMVTAMQSAPKGSLRVSVPVTFGVGHVSAAIATFLNEWPDVDVHLVLDDRNVELVAEGFDLAIRIGTLADSSLKARKLTEARRILAASPEYLAREGVPRTLDDLTNHQLLHYTNLATGNFWRLTSPSGEERQFRVGGRITANNGDALLKAAEAGLGIINSPTFITCASMAAGRLVEVLPDRAPDMLGIWAVHPEGRFTQPKLRALIEFLVERFKGMGPDEWP